MIGLLITARLKSTRLSKKALLPLSGKPMLARMIERLQLCRSLDTIAVCTSDLAEDDPLADLASTMKVECFRGDPVDVLRRIRDGAHALGLRTVVSATADNPLVDPVWAGRLIRLHLDSHADFGRISGLPFGTFCYTISRGALDRACEIKNADDTEVWGGYFAETGLFRTVVLEVDDPTVRHPEYRLTVDTPEDYQLMSRIFSSLHRDDGIFPLQDVIRLLQANPDLAAINVDIQQAAPKKIRVKPAFDPDRRFA